MTKSVIILGAGGHARVLIDAIKKAGQPIRGIVTRDPLMQETQVAGVPVIGSDETVFDYDIESVLLVNGLGSTGDTKYRRQLFYKFSEKGYRFAAVIHPGAILGDDVIIGEGSQIMAGAVIQTGTQIGRNVIINTRASVDHDCLIGDHVHIAPGAVLSGSVRVGEGSHIGTGAVVIQGVVIGDYSLISAGAVIYRNVDTEVTVRSDARMIVSVRT